MSVFRIFTFFMIAFSATSVFAQREKGKPKTINKNQVVNEMPAEDTDQKLAKDLMKRFPETANVTVAWKPVGYGYMAFYTLNNQQKMSLYSSNAQFARSFTQESWETRGPENVKNEFNNSPYNTYSVIVMWESDASDNKIYYLEMQDREGVSKATWFDENGKYFENPF